MRYFWRVPKKSLGGGEAGRWVCSVVRSLPGVGGWLISNPRQCTNASLPPLLSCNLHYTVTTLHYKNTATICNPRQCLTCSADDAVALPHCKYTEALHYNTNTNTLQIQIHCLQNLSAMHYLPSSAQLLQLQCILYNLHCLSPPWQCTDVPHCSALLQCTTKIPTSLLLQWNPSWQCIYNAVVLSTTQKIMH